MIPGGNANVGIEVSNHDGPTVAEMHGLTPARRETPYERAERHSLYFHITMFRRRCQMARSRRLWRALHENHNSSIDGQEEADNS